MISYENKVGKREEMIKINIQTSIISVVSWISYMEGKKDRYRPSSVMIPIAPPGFPGVRLIRSKCALPD